MPAPVVDDVDHDLERREARASPAAAWPLGTLWIPARTISATKAPL